MAEFKYESERGIFPSIIETDRLLFKPISCEEFDVKYLYELYSSVEIDETHFVNFTSHESIKETQNWIERSIQDFENGKSARYFLFEKNNGQDNEFIRTATFDPRWEKILLSLESFYLKNIGE